MQGKLPLSVSMISLNEESNLARTLEQIKPIASEIIIVDSGSTDRTIEIAKSFGAEVYSESWKGHVEQKNSALAKCSQPWILCLDCDEVPSDELINSISNAVIANHDISYYINRRTFYLGKLLKYAWQPDWCLRLVKKASNPVWIGLDPHDELISEFKSAKLNGDIIHYSYKNIYHHLSKSLEYARISAHSYHKNGKRFSCFKLIINPMINLTRHFIFNAAFLDGFRGLIVGFSAWLSTFMKYIFLWEIEQKKRKVR